VLIVAGGAQDVRRDDRTLRHAAGAGDGVPARPRSARRARPVRGHAPARAWCGARPTRCSASAPNCSTASTNGAPMTTSRSCASMPTPGPSACAGLRPASR
jgi:hypothetical protein